MDDFDLWNDLKKKIDARVMSPNFFPKENEVWMCSLGKNIGYEQCGQGARFLRPVLLLKKFNRHMFWAIPLSTKQKTEYFYYNFTASDGTKESAILAQLRLISVNRLTRKYFNISKQDLDNIKTKLISYINIKKNPA